MNVEISTQFDGTSASIKAKTLVGDEVVVKWMKYSENLIHLNVSLSGVYPITF